MNVKFHVNDIVRLSNGLIGQVEEEIYKDRYRVYIISNYAIVPASDMEYLCSSIELASKAAAQIIIDRIKLIE